MNNMTYVVITWFQPNFNTIPHRTQSFKAGKCMLTSWLLKPTLPTGNANMLVH